MKVLYLGVKRMAGNAKKNGAPFDFSNLLYARPVEPVARENLQISGHGYEQTEIAIDPQAMNEFAGVKAGSQVDIRIEPMPQNPQRNWCTGVAQ